MHVNLNLCAYCPRGVLALKCTWLMDHRKGSCEVIQKPLELKSPNHCCVPLYGVTTGPLALQHIAYKAVNGKSLCAMRQWTRASSQSRDRKKAPGSNPPSRAMHGGMVQPIENRAAQHYSGQPSSSHRGTETDAYASARHDYDAAQCPATFTGLPPSKLDTGSLTAACQFTFMEGVLPASSCKGNGLCVRLLFGGGQLVKQQSEEVTFSSSIRNPLLSYCAGSSFLCTSGNVFLLTGGGERGLRTPDGMREREKEKGCKNQPLWLKDSPFTVLNI